jgi:uncharacterized membrane protein YccC
VPIRAPRIQGDALKLTLIEALEIGVIATLSFAAAGMVTRQFHHESALLGGIWAAVSALVVYGVDRRQVFGNSRRRLIGSVLGGIVSGVLLVFFAPSLPLLGACAALTAGAVILMNLAEYARLAVVTTVVVFAVQVEHPTVAPFFNAGLRIVESLVGMIVCLAVVSVGALTTRQSGAGEADDDAM